MSYKDFTQKKGISGAIGLSNILSNIGIKTEEPNINKKLDTSARETLWDDLRKWRRDGSSSGRKLRRNEASQVEWIVRLRQENTRAWFLSIDGQLRRALITINKGAYAGFVVTPSAWAHMLADLHWGEFDVSAFSAMMWSLPSKTPEERAQDMILREVIRRLPEGESFDAETIRDQVDNYIVKENPLVNMPRKSSDSAFDPEEEYDFLSEMRGILPDAVERILDNITKKKVIRRKHSKNK